MLQDLGPGRGSSSDSGEERQEEEEEDSGMVDTSTSYTSSDQPTQKKKVFWPNFATIDGGPVHRSGLLRLLGITL